MRLGIAIGETWSFFHEIHAHLSARHEATLFKPRTFAPRVFDGRLNRYFLTRDLRSFMRQNDVVFFEWASDLLCAASRLQKTCGIVARLHRYEMYKWASQINWATVDRLILVSHAKYNEFASLFPAHVHKAVVIPEAVSTDRFQPVPKVFGGDIGILCHMKPRKRVYELVLAFHELLKLRPGFHLHVGGGQAAGFDEYFDAVRGLVKRLGLHDKVTFYGRVAKPEEWYRFVDIYVSNGYSEGLQVSPLEAMASGCYCLSHCWDGADELLPESNIFFTNTELVELILRYADRTNAERDLIRIEMRRRVCEQFNVDRTKVEIDRLVDEVGRQTSRR